MMMERLRNRLLLNEKTDTIICMLTFFIRFPKILIIGKRQYLIMIFGNIWKVLFEPDTNWRKLAFNDASWLQGQGGVGYGDGDDNTIINP